MVHVTRLTRGLRNARRLASMLQVLARHGFGEVITRLRLVDALPVRLTAGLRLGGQDAAHRATRGERLRAVLTELGPTYVKLGQVLSTRPDLIPPDICNDLEDLQDRVPPVSEAEAAQVIAEELGGAPGAVFQHFDAEPVASASIGQVHRAVLKDGAHVAVKIQRPDIVRVIQADIELLTGVAEWIVRHGVPLAGFDPVGTVAEFARSIERELDYAHEARTITCFARNFESCATVRVPRVYLELCTARVLTMEWIDGTSLRELDAIKTGGHDLARIARHGAAALLKQVFEDRLFHGDPHPGNIFVLDDDVVCFLDYGMVGQLTPDDIEQFAELLLGVFATDAERVTAVVLTLARTIGPVQRRALQRDLQEFIELDVPQIIERLEFGTALKQVIAILRRHNLVLPARYSLLVKALATMEQVGRELDPQIDLAEMVRPHVERIVRRRYSAGRIIRDVSSAMRDAVLLGRVLPGELRDLLEAFKREGLRVALRTDDLHRITESHERSANRLTFGIIIGALIVGSSLLMQTAAGPSLFGWPVIGLVGYLVAAVLGLAMIFSMWRSRRL